MNIFQTITAQPWYAEQSIIDNQYVGRSSIAYAKKIALRVFLGVVAILFILMLILIEKEKPNKVRVEQSVNKRV
jgi:hypothetical protein